MNIDNPEKLNILVIHGTLNGAILQEKNYNPISERVLRQKGFDYVALGHIHKTNYDIDAQFLSNNYGNFEKEKIIYPGSTVSMGFDELGKHGMVVGEIQKNGKCNLDFIQIDDKEFVEKQIDVTNILSKEELIAVSYTHLTLPTNSRV